MPNLLIAGHFGAGNVGDDAILVGFADGISRVGGFEITAMSGSPEDTFRNYNIRGIPRKNLAAFNEALSQTDALVFAGGSIFQDATSVASAMFYASLVKRAKKAGKKVFLVGQGVGPLTKFLSKRAAASAFNMADGIVVRDPISAQTLRDLGVKRPIKMGADSAFLLSPNRDGGENFQVGDRKSIGIAPKLIGRGLKESVALFGEFTRLVFQSNYMPIMIAMDRNEDTPLIQAINESQGGRIPDLRKVHRPQDIQARIQRMDAVVAVRLHAAILAASVGTPSLMISYDPKVSAFAKLIEAPCVPAEGLTSSRLLENFQLFMKNRERYVAATERQRAELVKLAEVNVETVVESLKGNVVAA